MSDIRTQIQEAMAKEMAEKPNSELQQAQKDVERTLAPEMEVFAEAYPFLNVQETYEAPVEIEVDGEKKEEEEREKRKRISAAERYKKNLMKEREENLRLRNELFERDLQAKNTEKDKRQIAYNFVDSKIQLYTKEYEDAALLEDQYNSLGDFESARLSRQKQSEKLLEIQKLNDAKQHLEQEYKLYQQEVQLTAKNRPQNYLPQFNDEPADEEEKANYHEFIKNNPYLNPEDPTNYIPEAWRVADHIHDEVVKLYKIRGHGDKVGSKAFFEDVGRITKERITGMPDNRSGNMNHNSIGAPSSRKLALDNKIQLTQNEAKIRSEYEKRFGKEYMKEYDAILKKTKQASM